MCIHFMVQYVEEIYASLSKFVGCAKHVLMVQYRTHGQPAPPPRHTCLCRVWQVTLHISTCVYVAFDGEHVWPISCEHKYDLECFFMLTKTHTNTRVNTHTHIQAHTHTLTEAHTHTHIHTHICMHTPLPAPRRQHVTAAQDAQDASSYVRGKAVHHKIPELRAHLTHHSLKHLHGATCVCVRVCVCVCVGGWVRVGVCVRVSQSKYALYVRVYFFKAESRARTHTYIHTHAIKRIHTHLSERVKLLLCHRVQLGL